MPLIMMKHDDIAYDERWSDNADVTDGIFCVVCQKMKLLQVCANKHVTIMDIKKKRQDKILKDYIIFKSPSTTSVIQLLFLFYETLLDFKKCLQLMFGL